MEVINGDYGDMVPKLAQAVLSGDCDAFNTRYKICLPKRFSNSPASSTKRSLLTDGKGDSTSCLSASFSNQSNGGSGGSCVDDISLIKKANYQTYNGLSASTDSSSKESSEEVGFVGIVGV